MQKVTIADCAFLPGVKSASVGQDNANAFPAYFEWEFCEPKSARFVTDGFITHANGKGQIGWLLEPFCLHPNYYLAALEKKFDFVLTHNRYFADNYGWLWHPFGGSWIDYSDWGIYEKTKDISIIVSQKRMVPGHLLRLEIAEKFKGELDVYGLEKYIRKIEALKDYRYSVVIEAERSFSFFNEKLIDCLSVGTIPIYWGCLDIGNYFDMRGIIEIDNIKELPNVIGSCTQSDYESRLPAIKKNMELARKYRITEDWIYKHYPFLFQ